MTTPGNSKCVYIIFPKGSDLRTYEVLGNEKRFGNHLMGAVIRFMYKLCNSSILFRDFLLILNGGVLELFC